MKKIYYKKLKKLITLSVLPLGIMVLTFTVSTAKKQKNQSINWYDNLDNKKFEVRGQGARISLNQNNEAVLVPLNNNFELKLLLNPGFETENEEFISKFNNEFINKVNKNNLIYKTMEKSTMMPIVWFYFETEQERQDFVQKLKSWKEIYKFIIFENNDNIESNYRDPLKPIDEPPLELEPPLKDKGLVYYNLNIDPFFQEYIDSVNKNVNIVNVQDYLGNSEVNKIGILESWTHPFDKNYQKYFKNGIEINDLNAEKSNKKKTHSTMVSMIAGGEYGIDRSSKIYLHTFNKLDSNWIPAIEKMVKDDGIRLINHSYGYTMYWEKNGKREIRPGYLAGYDENAYFLDYISRKYGVINVFAASNDGKDDEHLITGTQLSFNSIIVGALDDNATKKNLKYNAIAEYSNYRITDEFKDISKPLFVAPAQFYNPVYNVNNYYNGTSYAAPVVTGLISNLFKYNEGIKNSDNRVPIVKAILSASAISPKGEGLKYKFSGYEQKYGDGTVDFKAMLQAANNHKAAQITPTTKSGTYVLASERLELRKGQTIKISSSWTFNAGMLKVDPMQSYYSLTNNNYWEDKISRFALSRYIESREPIGAFDTRYESNNPKTHNAYLWLKKEEAKKQQNNRWFSDYDLILEKQEPNGIWKTAESIVTIVTNDELIEYKVPENGIYRYTVRKLSESSFKHSVDDIVAVTHVVRDEDY